MRLLLDENLPARLRHEFVPHEAFTVRYKGWSSKKNGELIRLMLADEFDALVTEDKSLLYQQNFTQYPVTVFVLRAYNSQYESLPPLVPQVMEYLNSGNMPIGSVIIQEANSPKT